MNVMMNECEVTEEVPVMINDQFFENIIDWFEKPKVTINLIFMIHLLQCSNLLVISKAFPFIHNFTEQNP